MKIDEENDGNLLVVKPVGKLDSVHGPDLEKAILGALERGDRNLLLDMSEVTYISSRGLRVFLLGAKKAKAEGGKISICALQEFVREVFDLSGFLTLFDVFESVAEARKSLGDGTAAEC